MWPHSIRYGREVGTTMLIFIMAMAYAATSPLILPFALTYFIVTWSAPFPSHPCLCLSASCTPRASAGPFLGHTSTSCCSMRRCDAEPAADVCLSSGSIVEAPTLLGGLSVVCWQERCSHAIP